MVPRPTIDFSLSLTFLFCSLFLRVFLFFSAGSKCMCIVPCLNVVLSSGLFGREFGVCVVLIISIASPLTSEETYKSLCVRVSVCEESKIVVDMSYPSCHGFPFSLNCVWDRERGPTKRVRNPAKLLFPLVVIRKKKRTYDR